MRATEGVPISRWIELCHRQLDELFLVHQEALLMSRLDLSGELLRCYGESLRLHMRFEEEHLFPGYEQLALPDRWPASLYVKEHAKILELLRGCEEELERLTAHCMDASGRRRGIIALLDREKSVKGVAEHHETREEEFMLPALEAELPEALHSARLAALQATWNAHMERTAQVVRDVCAVWK